MMGHFDRCEKVVFNDVNAMTLELFRMAINGELPPPSWMSSEEFRERNKAGEDDVIYADPPYAGKSGYGVAFDNEAFWTWCRRPRRALLIISEYSAPPDFVEIWAKQVTCAMPSSGNVGRPIERLFVHESQETLYWDMCGMPLLPLKFDDQLKEWRASNTSRLFLSNFVNKNK